MASVKTGNDKSTAVSTKPDLAAPPAAKPPSSPTASTSVAAVTATLPKVPPEMIPAVKTTAARATPPVTAASASAVDLRAAGVATGDIPAAVTRAVASLTEPAEPVTAKTEPAMTEPTPIAPAPAPADPVLPPTVPVAAVPVTTVPVAAPAVVPAAGPARMDVTPASLSGAPDPIETKQKTKEFAMTTTEEFLSQGQANVEAVIKSGQIWATGVQDIGRTMAESAQAHFEHGVATWKALAGTKSLKEAFDIQSSRARAAMEKAVADTGKLTDASLKLAEQTMAPITQRFSVATEKFVRAN